MISNAIHTGPSGGVGTAARTGSAGTSPPRTVKELKVARPICALDPTATADVPTRTLGTYNTDSTVRLSWPNTESLMEYSSCMAPQCTIIDPTATTAESPSKANTPAAAARNASRSQNNCGHAPSIRLLICEPTPAAAPTA